MTVSLHSNQVSIILVQSTGISTPTRIVGFSFMASQPES